MALPESELSSQLKTFTSWVCSTSVTGLAQLSYPQTSRQQLQLVFPVQPQLNDRVLQASRLYKKVKTKTKTKKHQGSQCLQDCLPLISPYTHIWGWGSPGKNTGVGCHFLLPGIFLTRGLNPGLLHCRRFLY